MHRFVVEREVAEKLKEVGQQMGATLFMVLLGGLDVLLSRYSGQEEVVVGTDIANRNRKEIEGLIGFFVNQLVLRVEIKAAESFRALLKRVKEVCLGAYAHQDTPFEKLVEELRPERDLSRAPLFQVKMILQNAPREGMGLEGMRVRGFGVRYVERTRLDLTAAIADVGGELEGVVEYSLDLFEEETIERLMSHYRNLLRGIVEDVGRAIGEQSILSEEERKQIIVGWNQTGKSFPDDRRIHELIAEQGERNPDRIALMCEERQVSYGELNRRANQVGNYLRGLGVGPEVLVGLCLGRSVEMVVAMIGVLKAGGGYLPLEAGSPVERVAHMLEDAGVEVVLTERELEKRLPAYCGRPVCLDEEWEKIGEESESEPESGVEAENLAYVIYTSGSTGRPKGVMINHRGLANYLRWATEAYRIVEGDGAPVNSSIGFDLTVTGLYGPLVNGKRVHLLSEEEGIEALARALSRERGYSLVKITPAHLEVLAQQMGDSSVEGRARTLVIGGEELRVERLKYWQQRSPGTRLINEYGPTETVVGCCVYEVNEAKAEGGTVPIGKPIANTQIYVLDRELEPMPIRVRGEIYISGAGVARGYLGKPDLTAERFLPSRFSRKGGERMYWAGDAGRYLADGNIEFMGRGDGQVKVRGYRIELGEIEAVLAEHPLVMQSVVVAREEGSGGKQLVGYVVGEEGVTTAELKMHVRERLPEYMAPSAIVVLEQMPLTANGKLNRQALPEPEGRGTAGNYEEPVGETETALARIWAEMFNLERVGRRDHFFELGGHSLLAVSLIERMRREGLHSDVRALFATPTLAEFAAATEDMEVVL